MALHHHHQHHHPKVLPAPEGAINLAIASLIVYAALFPLACFIAWKHGRIGFLCWPIFTISFVLRFITTGWRILHRDDARLSIAAARIAGGWIVSCYILSILGIIYEAGVVLPQIARPRMRRTILASFYAVMGIGIVLTAYGGRQLPRAPNHVISPAADQLGYCLFLLVIVAMASWITWTGRRMLVYRDHEQFHNAKNMLLAAGVCVSFAGYRLIYATVYSFTRLPSLNPHTGATSTRIVLVFLLELAMTVALCAGGWCSRGVQDEPKTCESPEPSGEAKETDV
ncbi:hypothetical protein E4U17_000388 [Claviceps sp. LM77 group G4]|nr:hypothetical protein E4U17_000388 [Claviceps sp. LM77 group G4]KAG6081663.1 hypothetical protein E4U33_006606 [Claviceps sp. LM78 group G4]KAG6082792.1 hypothetical protein E4U16_005531 [Claviceps sp. LM84 group G4]